MPIASDWWSAGVPQAAIAFREPGHLRTMALDCDHTQLLPPVSKALVPISVMPDADGMLVRLINPGSARCHWTPGERWMVSHPLTTKPASTVCLGPGELAELRLRQSS